MPTTATRLRSSGRTIILTSAMLLTASTSAFALEGKALFEAFVASNTNENVTYGTITEQSSDSFTIDSLAVKGSKGNNLLVKNVVVSGLKEADNNRIVFDSITFSSLNASSKDKDSFGFENGVMTNADIPTDIWKKELTAEEKRQRIRFGNLTMTGATFAGKDGGGSLDAVAIAGADIPLDFRYGRETNVTGEPGEPLQLGLLSFNGLTFKNKAQQSFELGSFAIKDIYFPTSIQVPMTEFMKAYSAITVNGVKFLNGQQQIVAMESLSATMSPPSKDGTFRQNSQVDGISIDLNSLPDPQAKAVAKQLGYDTLRGSMTANGSWNMATGRTTVDDLTLAFDDVASLKIAYSMDGYTEEIAKKISEIQVQATKNENPQAFLAILPELGKITIDSFSFDLKDASITRKLLEFQASNMGQTADALAAGAPMMIGLGMGQLNMPEFTQMVAGAVGKFLQNPGTLSVTASPENKVSILDVVTASQTNPKSIPDMLNVKVEAK